MLRDRENHAVWRCGTHEISLARPRIMGVLNVTPDSFSDGGKNLDPKAAIARGLQMLDEGADIIDVGGESTRPGHTPCAPDEEGRRVVQVVRELVEAGATVSIDTRHAEVARMCVLLGASIINDVTGFTDPAMVEVATECEAGCLVMHWDKNGLGSRDLTAQRPTRREVVLDETRPARRYAPPIRVEHTAVSQHRFTLPDEAPIMRQIMGFLGDQARTLMRAGVARDRIAVDPGPGFDKVADEDIVIQRATRSMVSMGYPLVTAVSRKRFVGAVSGVAEAADRDAATQGICIAAVANGARILRVHDVAGAAQAVNSYWAMAQKDPRQGFIGLGSSEGDRVANLAEAIRRIDEVPLTCVANVSHAYETEPAYGLTEPIANCVAEIRTELHPLVLMDHLRRIEDEMGRVREPGRDISEAGSASRLIDCDLLWVEGETHAGRALTLPHPRLGERDFTVLPMEDLVHNPERFLAHGGVKVLPREQRVGTVTGDLGTIAWE